MADDFLPVYAMNFGHENHFWSEAKQRDLIMFYESVENWEDLQHGREDAVRQRMRDMVLEAGKSPDEGWITQWIRFSRLMRDTEPAIFIHNERGIIWWAEAGSDSVDLGVREIPIEYDTAGRRRFVARTTVAGWSNRSRRGRLLQLSDLHPMVERISHTQATMQGVAQPRAEYIQALLDDEDLTPWHQLQDWRKVEAKGLRNAANISPVRGFDELIGSPTSYTSELSNQVEGYVYVIGLPAYPGKFKIGHANDVEARVADLQVAVPEPFQIHRREFFRNSKWAEAQMHTMLQHCHPFGEWFSTDLEFIDACINGVKKREAKLLSATAEAAAQPAEVAS